MSNAAECVLAITSAEQARGKPTAVARERPWLLGIGLTAFAIACVIVNPLREMAQDDDWAYALTVKHLLDTGEYRLNDWAAANMPFQIYWGAAFARLFGFSHSALRISTLVLFVFGLIGFYCLGREHELSPRFAGLVTLALASSPLAFRFSFNFMTDVPFLALLIVSLWLYSRALRLENTAAMLLASLAAAAAILTRQFGIALIGAILLLWLMDRQRGKRFGFYIAGLALPLAAAAWQIAAAKMNPNWTGLLRMEHQADYLAHPTTVAINLFWRPTVILQFLALFSLPIVFFALPRFRTTYVLMGLFAVAILAGLWIGRSHNIDRRLMPLIPWNFDELWLNANIWERRIVTLVTSIGAIALGVVVAQRYRGGGWHSLSPAQRLLDLCTLGLLALHLAYAQFGDEYLLVFLPFALIVLGRSIQILRPYAVAPAAIACLLMLCLSTVWTRGILNEAQAQWEGAEFARADGAKPRQISGSWTWECYHGAFDDYVADIHREVRPSSLNDQYDGLRDFFERFRHEREAKGSYIVKLGKPGREPRPGFEMIAQIRCRGPRFNQEVVTVERRRQQ